MSFFLETVLLILEILKEIFPVSVLTSLCVWRLSFGQEPEESKLCGNSVNYDLPACSFNLWRLEMWAWKRSRYCIVTIQIQDTIQSVIERSFLKPWCESFNRTRSSCESEEFTCALNYELWIKSVLLQEKWLHMKELCCAVQLYNWQWWEWRRGWCEI